MSVRHFHLDDLVPELVVVFVLGFEFEDLRLQLVYQEVLLIAVESSRLVVLRG